MVKELKSDRVCHLAGRPSHEAVVPDGWTLGHRGSDDVHARPFGHSDDDDVR